MRTRGGRAGQWALLVVLLVLGTALSACGSGNEEPESAPRRATATPSTPASTSTPKVLRVTGLGDSVMAGTNCDCPGVVKEYAAALADRSGRTVSSVDLSANGLTSQALLADLRDDAQHRAAVSRADVVLVTIGANDLQPRLRAWRRDTCSATCYRAGTAEMGQELGRILQEVDALRPGRTDRVLVTNYWNVFAAGRVARAQGGQAQLDWSNAVTASANQEICRAASTHGATCVDLARPFAQASRRAGVSEPDPLLADDGEHPNARGVALVVRALVSRTPGL